MSCPQQPADQSGRQCPLFGPASSPSRSFPGIQVHRLPPPALRPSPGPWHRQRSPGPPSSGSCRCATPPSFYGPLPFRPELIAAWGGVRVRRRWSGDASRHLYPSEHTQSTMSISFFGGEPGVPCSWQPSASSSNPTLSQGSSDRGLGAFGVSGHPLQTAAEQGVGR